jgi:hypothetical protein
MTEIVMWTCDECCALVPLAKKPAHELWHTEMNAVINALRNKAIADG